MGVMYLTSFACKTCLVTDDVCTQFDEVRIFGFMKIKQNLSHPVQRSRILYFLDMFLSKDADASLVGRILLMTMKKNDTNDSQELIISSGG
jgi:hypothetical protein